MTKLKESIKTMNELLGSDLSGCNENLVVLIKAQVIVIEVLAAEVETLGKKFSDLRNAMERYGDVGVGE